MTLSPTSTLLPDNTLPSGLRSVVLMLATPSDGLPAGGVVPLSTLLAGGFVGGVATAGSASPPSSQAVSNSASSRPQDQRLKEVRCSWGKYFVMVFLSIDKSFGGSCW